MNMDFANISKFKIGPAPGSRHVYHAKQAHAHDACFQSLCSQTTQRGLCTVCGTGVACVLFI